jgi:formylglycine-generating enzyme required for sulfatase activity
LQTEAEWEFAARGGDITAFDWNYMFSGHITADGVAYNDSKNAGIDSVGWYIFNNINGTTGDTEPEIGKQGYGTHQVGLKAPNALGIFDMSGNVCEWCWDWYNESVTSNDAIYIIDDIINNPCGASLGSDRVRRGGSWSLNVYFCSISYRDNKSPDYKINSLGIRVVRSIPE